MPYHNTKLGQSKKKRKAQECDTVFVLMCAIVEREGTQWEGVCVCVWKRTCTCANAVIFINLCTSIYWLISCLILNYAIKTMSASVVKLNPPGDLYVPTTPCMFVCVCVLFVFCSSPVTFRSMCDRCSSSHARTHTNSLLHSLSLSLPPQTQLQFDCFHFWLIVQCRRIFCHKQQFESNASVKYFRCTSASKNLLCQFEE